MPKRLLECGGLVLRFVIELGCVLVAAMLLVLSGCGPARNTEAGNGLCLDDYWRGTEIMGGAGMMCVIPDFRPGVDPNAFLQMAVWYLRHKPEAVTDSIDDAKHAINPMWPRARAVLASWVASQKDILFCGLGHVSDADLDLSIKELIEEIDKKEADKQSDAGCRSRSPTSTPR